MPYLPPDAFAIVMATGIVSLAAGDHGFRVVSAVLATLATAAFAVLAAAWGAQFLARRGAIIADFRDPDVALRMFTFVAGACVLGVVWLEVPVAVWVVGVAAAAMWLVLIPLAARDVRSRPRTELRDHARGAWLLGSVATSGIAITAGDLAVIDSLGWLLDAGIAVWIAAWALYAAVACLIVWRAWAHPLRAESMTPDTWILMGGLAIAALAGAHLTDAGRVVGSLAGMADWVPAATVAIWAVATAWIPLLVAAQLWQAIRVPGSIHFTNVWWSAVFPLGMYATATAAIAGDVRIGALWPISLVFTWIALGAWLAAAAGLVHSAVRRMSRHQGGHRVASRRAASPGKTS